MIQKNTFILFIIYVMVISGILGRSLFKVTSPENKDAYIFGVKHYGNIKGVLEHAISTIDLSSIYHYAVEDYDRVTRNLTFVREMEKARKENVVPDKFEKAIKQNPEAFWPENHHVFQNEEWKKYSGLYIYCEYQKLLQQYDTQVNFPEDEFIYSTETWILDYLKNDHPEIKQYNLEPTDIDYRKNVLDDYFGTFDPFEIMRIFEFLDDAKNLFKEFLEQRRIEDQNYKTQDAEQSEKVSDFFRVRNQEMVNTLMKLVNDNKYNTEGILAVVGEAHTIGSTSVLEILKSKGYSIEPIKWREKF